MFCLTVSLFLAFSLPVHGSFRKSSGCPVKLPGCAIWAERLDSQTERDSFYEGLPDSGDSVETAVPESLDTSVLPFGYPDSVAGVIEGIPEPGSVCIEPSGLYLYVCSFSTGAVHVLRVSSLEQVRILSTGFEPDTIHHTGTLEMHPRGGYIYITNPAEGTVIVVRSLDWGFVTSIDIGQSPADICFSPAGDRAYVACRGSDQVFILE